MGRGTRPATTRRLTLAVRLGVNPIGWTNDDLIQLGDATPVEVCLAEARAAGYEGIELGRKFPRRAAELAALLARHGLALISGWYGAELTRRSVKAELAAAEDHLALLAELGSPVVILAEVSGAVHGARSIPLSRRPRLADAEWPRFGDALSEVAEQFRARGMRMAYHHHMGTVVETEEEIDRLMATTGEAVGLLLDTGHLAYAGGDPARVARRHAARIVHLHAKDVRPRVLAEARRHDWSFLDAVLAGVFTVPGDGGVDYGPVLQRLRDARYAGWLVVEAEQDPAVADPLTYARMGHAYLGRAVADAGL